MLEGSADPKRKVPAERTPSEATDRFAAFLSYARADDRLTGGLIARFRELLSGEVQLQTGAVFPIFQDIDIAWGENWRLRVDEALDAASLLLPVVTPGFFRSQECRSEVERFLDRERRLNMRGLLLPLYLVTTEEFEDPRKADELARVLATRQRADWRELRAKSFDSEQVRLAIERLAGDIVAAVGVPKLNQRIDSPQTIVVDAYGRRDFTTITAAIDAARGGERILVLPGQYPEALVIDKPLDVVGDGPRADIVVRAKRTDVVHFKAAIGRIAGVTLVQEGRKGGWNAVDISAGRLVLENCDVSCTSGGGVIWIHDGADPRVRDNYIHRGKESGVLVSDRGLGIYERNDIASNECEGFTVESKAHPTVRNNVIRNSGEEGVWISEKGRGIFEFNNIIDNGGSGVATVSKGDPILRRNRISGNAGWGVLVGYGGRGKVERNDLRGNNSGAIGFASIAADGPKVSRVANLE